MRVKLKVASGKNAGHEIAISVPEFVIGRGDDCHLRPRSDLVSRRHTAITVGKDGAKVRDLGSRNGTFLNGEQIEGEQPLKVGDLVRIGKLELEVLIDHAATGTKRPKVHDVKEAAARTADAKEDGFDVDDWLDEADEAAVADPETRQFKLEEVNAAKGQEAAEVKASEEATDEESEADTAEKRIQALKKQQPGKLPKRPDSEAKNSKEAATQMLKQFFNRR